MRKLSLMLTISLLMGQVSNADCVSDCKKVIQQADNVIAQQQRELDLYSQEIAATTDDIAKLNAQVLKDQEEESSIWHNPLAMIALGLIVGAAGGAYLAHH
jgi:uncharacterized coiled-coil protein SlyX